MDFGIRGRRALVTGGSRGLGRSCALALAAEGVDVAICARDSSGLELAVGEIEANSVKCYGFKADLSNEGEADEIFAKSAEALGGIDIMVNNVGGSLGTKGVVATSFEDFRRVHDLNFWSATRLMKLSVSSMVERGWGRIINITSIYGREYGGSAPYMSAKAGLIALGKHLAMDTAKTGVTVNSIAPGSILIKDGSWDRFISNNSEEAVGEFIDRNLPMGRFGWPEPIGAACAFLASEQSSLITGVCLNIDGGQSRSLI